MSCPQAINLLNTILFMYITFRNKTYSLPMIAQYQSIPYEAGLCCSHCSNFVREYRDWMTEMKSDRVRGYCIDGEGAYQIVLECKYCHEKYRFHMAKYWYNENGKILFDLERWKQDVGLHLYLYSHDYLVIDQTDEII